MTGRLTRDGTAEPVARDDIVWRERGQEKCSFLSFSLLQMMSWQRHPVDPYHTLLKLLIIQTYIYFIFSSNEQRAGGEVGGGRQRQSGVQNAAAGSDLLKPKKP